MEGMPKMAPEFRCFAKDNMEKNSNLTIGKEYNKRYNKSTEEKTPCGVGKACQPSATHLCDHSSITQTLYTRVLYFRAYHSTMEYQKSSV